MPLAYNAPPIARLPPIPIPPVTTNAPVVVDVACVFASLNVATILLVVVPPTCTLTVVPVESVPNVRLLFATNKYPSRGPDIVHPASLYPLLFNPRLMYLEVSLPSSAVITKSALALGPLFLFCSDT